MEYLLVCSVALFVSGLTLFSGFGLGTLLMPAFALFFPLPVAIAATAVVHLANNLFKVALVGRAADWGVVARFALPGALAAMVGAATLRFFADLPPLFHYALGSTLHAIAPLKLVIGLLIVGFALLELLPGRTALAFGRRFLIPGGLLSGFFGGLSGNQGAFRAAFLLRAGLSKEGFVATGTVAAVIVDCARLLVYGQGFYAKTFTGAAALGPLVGAATVAAFLGALVGRRLLKKMTLATLHRLVGTLLVMVGLGLASGLI
ncbi:MAG TPA: TSUP family transporter [Desulfurivibrionaceae bacterium]|nr:TSUP family transporter [Desulfurivibrionaceae bacterium]